MAASLPTPPTSPARDSEEPPCVALRDRLEAELVPEDSTIPEHKKFFPRSRLAAILNENSIKDVLDCWCPKCHECQQLSGASDSSKLANAIIGDDKRSNGLSTGAVNLFALLLYIEYPSLINCFLTRQIGDHELDASAADFSAAYVQRVVGPLASTKFPRLAERFHWKKHQFVVPEIHDSEYMVFSKDTILPFVNETPIGRPTDTGEIINEGSYGKVYSFEILEGYGGFKEFPGVRKFARKELHANTPESRFMDERSNLFSVKKLQDDHLVKIVTTYKHGNVFNLVFPLAKANLHRYLREPHYQPFPGVRCGADHPLWQQLLGLAEGLRKVQHFHEDTFANEDSMFGYHFDLKPANILVDNSERLVITDFGQAYFKPVKDSTNSRVVGMGGTEAYAPPELDDDGIGLNRKYDIWSLGCVFLEVLVFVVGGANGLLELDRSRVSKDPETRNTDNRFFRYNSFSRSYALKPEILDQVQLLHRNLQDEAEKEFHRKFLKLVLRMLDVNPKTRLASKEVCILLSRILIRFKSRGQGDSTDSCASSQSTCPGVPVGNDIIDNLQTVSFKVDSCWTPGPIQIMQEGMQLRIQTPHGSASNGVLLGNRDRLRISPEYALHNQASRYLAGCSLSLVPGNLEEDDVRKCTFDCGRDVLAIRKLQEVFLGEEVVHSFRLKSAHLSIPRRKSITRGFRRTSSGSKSINDPDDFGEASAIQLWKESSHADVVAMSASAHPPQRQFRPAPPQRRVVVFYERAILILRVAKNFRLNKATPHSDDNQSTLELVPTAESVDRSFSVALLRQPPERGAPSFALVREEFELEETKGLLECSSLTLSFHNVDEAESFYRSYRAVKKEWMEELKPFDAARLRVGSGHFDFKRK